MQRYTGVRSETFEWVGPIVGPRVETGMSGLAYLTGIRDGAVVAPDLGPLVSAELVEIVRGRVQLICSASPSQFGLLRELDPAVASLLVNAAVTAVAQSLTGHGQGWATVESRESYTRPSSPEVGNLVATAEVIGSSRGRAEVKGELLDGRGRVVATIVRTIDILDLDVPLETSAGRRSAHS
ncbi:MAG TPA: hypothetical protein VGM94_03395 [Galbitalea sp.]